MSDVRPAGVANEFNAPEDTDANWGGVDTLVEAGDCVHQRPGIVHSLYDWSDDMEFMEIIMPGDFVTTEITG